MEAYEQWTEEWVQEIKVEAVSVNFLIQRDSKFTESTDGCLRHRKSVCLCLFG